MKELINIYVSDYYDYCLSCYTHLHQYPELSFQEFRTSEFIQAELNSAGIPFRAGIAGTGILARIEGKNPTRKIIALRADMDALPVCEETGLSFKSKSENIMHACGHDTHVACLLTTARILKLLSNRFEGTVLLVFQPGEEKAPGGARLMMDDGVFDDIRPELMLAQHISVDYPTGTLAFGDGKIMASADEIHVVMHGKGGHGALPHLCNDTVLAASQAIVSLQQVKSRLCHPLTPMVLTFGKFTAGGAQNIIPGEVHFSGTFRTFDEDWRKKAKEHIVRIIEETAKAYGCRAEINIPDGYPCVENDREITRVAASFAEEWVGAENVKKLETRLTSEDFGFFSQMYPSTFYRFGAKSEINKDAGGLHSSTFFIDKEALKTGIGGLTWIAFNFLNRM